MGDSNGANTFSTLLRAYRRTRGLTQEALAERAGLGVRTIQGLEDGSHQPQQATVVSLADALGLDLEERRTFQRAGAPSPRDRRRDGEGALTRGLTARDTAGRIANNLGVELTSFVGREVEIVDLRARLVPATSHPRLVTLIGAGGCGKTRLARWVARDLAESYSDGAWFVDLAPLADSIAVPSTIVAALGLSEQPGRPAEVILVDYLRDRQALLILDNCEHLLDATSRIAPLLLEACPHLRILATSRERLRVNGEVAIRVPSLATPPGGEDGLLSREHVHGEDLDRFDAVRLFLERARAVEPLFQLTPKNATAVAEICFRLDGIPLAIELAAARVPTLGVEQINRRLDDRFRLLTGGNRAALPRQQTLRASLEWSHALLAASEQVLFRRLAVFAGGFTIEAAEQVTATAEPEKADAVIPGDVVLTVASLVDKSLIHVEANDDEVRYRLLETVRQYANERLVEAGEGSATRIRHLDWFTKLAERAAPELDGPRSSWWVRRFEAEHDNFRAALVESLAHSRMTTLRLAGCLALFWRIRGYLGEGIRWLDVALKRQAERESQDRESLAARAGVLQSLGILERDSGQYLRAIQHCQDAVRLLHDVGTPYDIAQARAAVATVLIFSGRYDEGRPILENDLPTWRNWGDYDGIASVLWQLADCARQVREFSQARAYLEEILRLPSFPNSQQRFASARLILGALEIDEGNPAAAQVLLERARAYFLELRRHRALGFTLQNLGRAAVDLGDEERGRDQLRESLNLHRTSGDLHNATLAVEGFARLAARRGEHARALRLAGAAHAMFASIDTAMPPSYRLELERRLAQARSALSAECSAAAWSEGNAMSPEQAMDYALDLTDADT